MYSLTGSSPTHSPTGEPEIDWIREEFPTTRSDYAQRETALLYTARFTPEMLRLSGMPIKIKDRPFKFGTRL